MLDLDALAGLRLEDAKNQVEAAGYSVYLVPHDLRNLSPQSGSNPVILWLDESGTVQRASSGDILSNGSWLSRWR